MTENQPQAFLHPLVAEENLIHMTSGLGGREEINLEY
jgi:hypothetical protein